MTSRVAVSKAATSRFSRLLCFRCKGWLPSRADRWFGHWLAVENDGSRSRMSTVIKKVCSYSRFLDICRLKIKKFVIRDGITR